jgi:hypothetical protein
MNNIVLYDQDDRISFRPSWQEADDSLEDRVKRAVAVALNSSDLALLRVVVRYGYGLDELEIR